MAARAGGMIFGALALLGAAAIASANDWPTYGRDAGGMRHSPLAAVTPANVGALREAWVYHMRPAAVAAAAEAAAQVAVEEAQRRAENVAPRRRGNSRFNPSQATPLVVGGRMFLSTPYRRVVALEPETGRELWAYDVPGPGQPSLRGVEYWPGNARHAPRILFGTRDGRLIALDAATGIPSKDFGVDGVLNLATPDVIRAAPTSQFSQYGMTSPPIVYRDLVITGAAVQEFPQRGAAGDVRAWDVVTGKLRWTFHTVPRPGEFGHDTWEGDSWRDRSGTNVWGFMSVDVPRGLVYLPIGAPTWDRYGGDRGGANLFGSSVVALDAKTGRRVWHFQLVHHDIWDFDTESAPLLLEVRRGSRRIPAVAIVAKSGMLYLLDRTNGKPLFPIEERPVPASEVPGERAFPTQPISSIEPFARQQFAADDVATVTPELEKYCRDWIAKFSMRGGPAFTPIGFGSPTIHFPGRLGGANWGGATFDPDRRLLLVNASNLGHVEILAPREDGSMTNASPASGRFSDRDRRWMCQQPPWGTLTAYDVDRGKIVWQVPLGVTDSLPEAVQRTGRPNIGGAITTASGLTFVGATDDARFRAFDSASGKELWSVKLGASAHATPITYLGKDGKQYVAIVGTGGSFLDSPVDSDALTVFALP